MRRFGLRDCKKPKRQRQRNKMAQKKSRTMKVAARRKFKTRTC